jgi:hypothetical protein
MVAEMLATRIRLVAAKPAAFEQQARCQIRWKFGVEKETLVTSAKEGSQSQKADSSLADRNGSLQCTDLARVRVGEADRAALGF